MDLPNEMAQDFAEIVNVEVVVIADDSGSMMGSRWSEVFPYAKRNPRSHMILSSCITFL